VVWLLWAYWRGQFFDPARQITTITGRAAIALLVLTLACTPISIVLGWKRVLRVRRTLGLYSFLYVVLHFLTFAGWDYAFQLDLLWPALFSQRFVVFGVVALMLLIPLSITSTRGWQKRLGKKWRWLHRLTYLAAILALRHYLWIGKDPTVPLRYTAVVALLMVVRLPWVRRWFRKARLGFQPGRAKRRASGSGPTTPRR
jgi:sulfoxide reductase heme-binding subunit YedZ